MVVVGEVWGGGAAAGQQGWMPASICPPPSLRTPSCLPACLPPAATKLDADSLEAIAGDAPSATLPRDQLVGAALADVMVAVGMQPSKAAVRRMIKVRIGACCGHAVPAVRCCACGARLGPKRAVG